MNTTRLEVFSDGVLAIIITVMVLELKVPHDASLASLRPGAPVFASYVLSVAYIGIFWNNHHHLRQATDHVVGAVQWAKLHLVFWLSLVSVVTGRMGKNHFAATPMAMYGVVLLMAAIAYDVLQLVWLAGALYAGVALIRLLPDRRIERAMAEQRRD